MNKTIDISLAGLLFHLEEQAYYKLKKYLKAVRRSIGQTEDIEEVMHEIEARVAELLMQKIQSPQQVINEKHIDEIITVMGQPEDFEEEVTTEPTVKNGVKKALYRDMNNSMIAGVAAGLAHYLGMDVTLMRLIFIILLFVTSGTFILIYVLLWIIVPKAKTASDKLKMKGEQANVDNIVDQVSTGETKKKMNIGETIEETGSHLGNILVKLIGFFIVLVTGALLSLLMISALTLSPLTDLSLMLDEQLLREGVKLPLSIIGLLSFIILGFPVALLFLLGFKLLFPNTNPLRKNVLIITGTIWFLSLIYLIMQMVSVAAYHNKNTKVLHLNEAWKAQTDTLFVSGIEVKKQNNRILKNNDYTIRFKASSDNSVHIKVFKIAEGLTENKAREKASAIELPVEIDSLNNRIDLGEMMRYHVEDALGKHRVEVIIAIPENKFVKVDRSLANLSKAKDCRYPLLIKNENDRLVCLDKIPEDEVAGRVYISDDKDVKIKVNNKGVYIIADDSLNDDDAEIQLDENGIKIKTKEGNKKAQINIDKTGIKIQTDDN